MFARRHKAPVRVRVTKAGVLQVRRRRRASLCDVIKPAFASSKGCKGLRLDLRLILVLYGAHDAHCAAWFRVKKVFHRSALKTPAFNMHFLTLAWSEMALASFLRTKLSKRYPLPMAPKMALGRRKGQISEAKKKEWQSLKVPRHPSAADETPSVAWRGLTVILSLRWLFIGSIRPLGSTC